MRYLFTCLFILLVPAVRLTSDRQHGLVVVHVVVVVVMVVVIEGCGGGRTEVVGGQLLRLDDGHAQVLPHVLQHLDGGHGLRVVVVVRMVVVAAVVGGHHGLPHGHPAHAVAHLLQRLLAQVSAVRVAATQGQWVSVITTP